MPEVVSQTDCCTTRSDLPLQLLALGLMADGANGSENESPTAFIQDCLREGLQDARAILRESLSTPNTTIEQLLYEHAEATRQYAAIVRNHGDVEVSQLVCETARRGVFAGMALGYLFFVEGGR
jgi:hypothetical protein